MASALPPGANPIGDMSFNEIRLNYVRYIGAGAVAAAGLITLIKTLPTIAAAFSESFKSLRDLKARRRPEPHRARHPDHLGDRRLAGPGRPSSRSLPQLPGERLRRQAADGPPGGRLRLLLRHRLVAHRRHHRHLVEPGLRHDDRDADGDLPALRRRSAGPATPTRRSRSASARMVCIAASNAGNTSQDLKTGYLVGATPKLQQFGLIIGVVVSVVRGRLDHHADRQRPGRRSDRARVTPSARRTTRRRRRT